MATSNNARRSLAPATPSPQLTGCNPLVQSKPCDTLSAAREVLAFVRDWSDRSNLGFEAHSERGLSWVLAMIDDAVSVAGKQIQGGAQ